MVEANWFNFAGNTVVNFVYDFNIIKCFSGGIPSLGHSLLMGGLCGSSGCLSCGPGC